MTHTHGSFLTLASLALIASAGCSHARASNQTTTAEASPAASSTQQKQQLQATTATEEPAKVEEKQAAIDLTNALADLKNTRVFFNFNDDTLTDEARQKLATVGDILAKHPTFKIRVEGNCDERGTEEYNLALGQRRADAARKYLMNVGVQDQQVATISYGKEHPVVDGHTEDAWQQNRRDDVIAVSHPD